MQAGGRRFEPGYLHQFGLKTGRRGKRPVTGLFFAGMVTLPSGRVCDSAAATEDVRYHLMAYRSLTDGQFRRLHACVLCTHAGM